MREYRLKSCKRSGIHIFRWMGCQMRCHGTMVEPAGRPQGLHQGVRIGSAQPLPLGPFPIPATPHELPPGSSSRRRIGAGSRHAAAPRSRAGEDAAWHGRSPLQACFFSERGRAPRAPYAPAELPWAARPECPAARPAATAQGVPCFPTPHCGAQCCLSRRDVTLVSNEPK